MDDIDTRLEAERPEVAGVLRSMNWEERLEQARARRQAVLDRNTSDDKRPVVRIIDAAAVARKRADHRPVGPARPAAIPAAPPAVAPKSEAAAPPLPETAATEVPPAVARTSTVGRTAIGFGLGLGLGASLVAGAFLLFGLPGTPAPPAGTATAVAPAVVPQRSIPAETGPRVPAAPPPDLVPAATGAAPRTAAVAPGPAVVPAPVRPPTLVPDAAPLTMPLPGLPAFARLDIALPQGGPGGETPVLAAVVPVPTGRPAPAGPAALAPDATPRRLVLPAPPAFAPAAVALAAPAIPGEAAPVPAAMGAASGTAPRASGGLSAPAAGGIAPRVEAAASRPAADFVPAMLPGAVPADAGVLVPADIPSPALAALPAAPGATEPSDGRPAGSLLPPAPPPPAAAAPEPDIPGAAEKFVRLAVPQSVADAEAEEIAGLLKELGIGDSRVTRVGYKVSESHVRYYHRDDAPAAAALAAILGTEARDHTAFRPRPPDGTMEVFLAGERIGPTPRVASAPKRAAPAQAARPQVQPPDPTAAMRDRIVNRLRRGEHL